MTRCRFSLWAILAAAWFLATCANAAEKLQADLIPVGIRARNNAPIPVDARFKWNGTRVLEGKLELEFHEGNRILGRYRTDDLALTTGEQRFHMLLPALLQPSSDSQVEVRMKFVTAEEVFTFDPSSLFLPTASERALSLGWCNARVDSAPRAFDLEQSLFFEHFSPQLSSSSQRQLLTSMVRLGSEDLPIQPLSYTAFDVMVLTAEGFSEAHEGQLQTLARWVKGGGSVCVFVGGGLQPHHLSFLNALVDTNSLTPVFMADNAGNLLPGMNKISCFRSGVGRSVVVTGNIQPDPGLGSAAWREAVEFLWKMRESQRQAIRETGHWEAPTNFDWQASFPTESYPYQYRQGRQVRVRQNAPTSFSVQLFNYGTQATSFGAELITQLMPRTVRLIPFPALLGILGVFLLMIGPGDYFLLGWLRRRRYTWVLFPTMSIVFTLGTVMMANHYLGLRDQRRSLIIVDVDKEGNPLRWDRYELVFAARDKQSVTELKDALWSHLDADVLPMDMQMMPPGAYRRPYYPGQAGIRYGQANFESEAAPAWYDGTLPAHFRTSKSLRQWRPELNRVFSFAPPPAPMLANWSAIEDAWPDLDAIRGKLSVNKSFNGDVCLISGSEANSTRSVIVKPPDVVVTNGDIVIHTWASDGGGGTAAAPTCRIEYDAGSRRILSDSILANLCLGDSMMGFRSLVSQISPTGGGNFEDAQVMDVNESALAIVTQVGDDIVVYRRIFHAN